MVHYSPVIARNNIVPIPKKPQRHHLKKKKHTHTQEKKKKKKPQLPKHFTSFSSYGVTLIIDSAAD